jgi:hypothetical protein
MNKIKLRLLEAFPLLVALGFSAFSMHLLTKDQLKRKEVDEASAKRTCELEKEYIKVQCKQMMDACNK